MDELRSTMAQAKMEWNLAVGVEAYQNQIQAAGRVMAILQQENAELRRRLDSTTGRGPVGSGEASDATGG